MSTAYDNSMATLKANRDRNNSLLMRRKAKLLERLKQISIASEKQRANKISVPGTNRILPTVAVIGYTNSGKTSLVRLLTHNCSAIPEDRLFATLDVSHYSGRLHKSGHPVLFSDTVGFLSDLPSALVASFRTTLSEIRHSDLLIHVRDVHNPESESQKERVLETLERLNLPAKLLKNAIDCCNKIDLLAKFECPKGSFPISCTSNKGIDELKIEIEARIFRSTGLLIRTFKVPSMTDHLNFLYGESHVINIHPLDRDHMLVTVVISSNSLHKYESRFGAQKKKINLV